MTKKWKFIPLLVCAFLVAGSGVAVAHSMHKAISSESKATTTELSLSLGRTNNKSGFYVIGTTDDLPYNGDWNTRYYPTTADCIKVDGVSVANKLYPGSVGSNQSLCKYDAGKFFFDIGSSAIQNVLNTDSTLTLGGTWGATIGETEYLFTLKTMNLVWTGTSFLTNLDAYDLETYDIFTLRDAGIFEFERAEMSTEDKGCLAYNSWEASADNIHRNFEFSFELESYDASSTPEYCLRMGSSEWWDVGHYFQFNFFVQANDCITIGEWDNGRLWHSGDIPCSIGGEKHIYSVGNVRIKNSNDQITFFKVDGNMVYSTAHSVPTTTALTTHVGLYHPGTDMSMRNAWPLDKATTPLQTVSYDGERGGPNGMYFRLPENNGAYEEGNWDYRYYPTERSCLLKNGAEFLGWKQNLLVKFTATRYYVALSDWGYGGQTEGTIMTIGGVFRRTVDGVSTYVYIEPTSFILKSNGWSLYEFNDLAAATEGELSPTDLLANIGKWNPAHNKQCVKEFDQDSDSLVYKKDRNGNVGVYFTNSNQETHGEFRVYLPGNGYKSETKCYALTQLTFDYILLDSGVATEQGRNHSIDENGYFVQTAGAVANKFTIQAMCQHTHTDTTYFDRDVELVNDGKMHSVTLSIPYADICGFCFVLWNFDGAFFMSNCHADYLEYDQALNEFVTESLKMYHYLGSNQCGDYYAGAKAAYEALTAAEKGVFNTEAAYASARARLSAWAIANGETFDPISGTFTANTHGLLAINKNSNVVIITVVVGVIAMISLAGVMLAIRRRRLSK